MHAVHWRRANASHVTAQTVLPAYETSTKEPVLTWHMLLPEASFRVRLLHTRPEVTPASMRNQILKHGSTRSVSFVLGIWFRLECLQYRDLDAGSAVGSECNDDDRPASLQAFSQDAMPETQRRMRVTETEEGCGETESEVGCGRTRVTKHVDT
eukprot:1016630-Rhodomonas_salina.1